MIKVAKGQRTGSDLYLGMTTEALLHGAESSLELFRRS